MVAHHFPAPTRNPNYRIQLLTRDTFWYYWLRRPLYYALRHTLYVHRLSRTNNHIRQGYWDALRAFPRLLFDAGLFRIRWSNNFLKSKAFTDRLYRTRDFFD